MITMIVERFFIFYTQIREFALYRSALAVPTSLCMQKNVLRNSLHSLIIPHMVQKKLMCPHVHYVV